MIYAAIVEFDDDGASMAGALGGTRRSAEAFQMEAESKADFSEKLHELFAKERYYSTIRRINFDVDLKS